MSDTELSLRPPPGTVARYRIAVEGCLSAQWSGRLGGMQIVTAAPENSKSVTTLIGPVRDQAALLGVLNSLYELHLKILLVERMSNDE